MKDSSESVKSSSRRDLSSPLTLPKSSRKSKNRYPVTELSGEQLSQQIERMGRIESAWRELVAQYAAMIEAFDGHIYICSDTYEIEFMNKRLIERTGRYAVGEKCYKALHNRKRKCPWCINERVFRGETVRWEVRSPKDNRWYYIVNTPIQYPDGRVYKMAMIQDITAHKEAEKKLRRATRALQALSECRRALLRSTDEASLSQELCRIIVETGGYRLAWVGFTVMDEEKSVRPVGYAGFEEGYLESLKITWADTERGRGPTGTAIRSGQPSICRNILTDPRFEPWRVRARKRGYKSSIALPLLAEREILGTLNIYAQEPDAFDAEEVELLQKLADDLAYGLTVLRLRQTCDR